MNNDIIEVLGKYIAAEMLKQPDRILAPDEKIISSGLVDSFNLVDLALAVEDNYGVLIDDAELNAETFDTLEQLAALVQQRISA